MRILILVTMLFCSASAMAKDIVFGPSQLQSDFRAISEDMAGAFSYKPLDPAESAGIAGFRVAALISYTRVANTDSWQTLMGQKVEELGFVALSASKGLPFGIDVSAFIAEVPDSNAGLYGVGVKYAFIEGGVATPAVALRAAHTRLTGVDDLDFDTTTVDLSISKGFPLLTPYIGAGQVWASSDPDAQFVALNKESFEKTKLFGGVEFSLLPFKVLLEADATGDTTSFNLKAGFGF